MHAFKFIALRVGVQSLYNTWFRTMSVGKDAGGLCQTLDFEI